MFLNSGAGVDTGDMAAEVAALFGKTEGFKAADPAVTVIPEDMSDVISDMAFRSKLEEKVADLLVDLGVKYEYETTKVRRRVIQHIYTPDFVLPNGVVLEWRGYWEPADRRKIRGSEEKVADLDLRMVLVYKISKKSKQPKSVTYPARDIPDFVLQNIPLGMAFMGILIVESFQ